MSSQKKRGTKRKIRSVSGRVPVGRNNTKKMTHVSRTRTNMNNLANAFAGMYINKRRKPKTKKYAKKKGAYQRAKQVTERSSRAARRSYLKSKAPKKSAKKGRSTNAFRFNNMMNALKNM